MRMEPPQPVAASGMPGLRPPPGAGGGHVSMASRLCPPPPHPSLLKLAGLKQGPSSPQHPWVGCCPQDPGGFSFLPRGRGGAHLGDGVGTLGAIALIQVPLHLLGEDLQPLLLLEGGVEGARQVHVPPAEGDDLVVAILQLLLQQPKVRVGARLRVAVHHEQHQPQDDEELDEGGEEEDILHVKTTVPLGHRFLGFQTKLGHGVAALLHPTDALHTPPRNSPFQRGRAGVELAPAAVFILLYLIFPSAGLLPASPDASDLPGYHDAASVCGRAIVPDC